jgi:enediyne biosynthesis protein E4
MFSKNVAGFLVALTVLIVSGCSATQSGANTDPDVASRDVSSGDSSGDMPRDLTHSTVDMSSDGADISTTCISEPAAPPSENFFVDISATSGIQAGNYQELVENVPINDHSRLAFVDLNGDGLDDIVMHSLYPNPEAGIPFEHLVFFSRGDGTFEDATDRSGLRSVQAGFFAFGDVDNDGDQDVFAGLDVPLTGRTHEILLNDSMGHFTVLDASGVDAPSIPTIAATAVFFDADGDADLDLFVGCGHTRYAAPDLFFLGRGDGHFDLASDRLPGNPSAPSNGSVACDYDDDGDLDIFVSTYSVSTSRGENILWENQNGSFVNVAEVRGFEAQPTGNSYLASTGNGTAVEPGVAPGQYVGSNGFGIDCADVDGDGYLDVFLATISHPVDGDYLRKWSDPTQVLINRGPEAGYAFENATSRLSVPFNEGDIDAAIIDFDNDGRLDLSLSRENKYERNYPETAIDQRAWFGLLRQSADGTFESLGYPSGINETEATLTASLIACQADTQCPQGEACLADRCRTPCTTASECPTEHEICHGRGFCRSLLRMKRAQNHAWSDIDRDGDLDLLVGGRDAGGGRPNFLFRNDIGSENRWVGFWLEGDGQTVNRDAIGARGRVVFPDGRVLLREVKSARGTYNSSDMRALHFGLGGFGCEYTVEVLWPDGTKIVLDPAKFEERRYHRLRYPDTLESF